MSEHELRLLAVHAHPDDESSKGAAAMAHYAASGVRVMVASLTGGERGDVLNPRHPPVVGGLDGMAQVRRVEMAAAAAALGVEHRWVGFVDSGLPEGDPLPPLPEGSFATVPLAEASRPLVELIREFRPHVVTTYDPSGGYPHPDHIMCHRVSWEAFHAAGDAAAYPGTGDAWQPLKLYYVHGFTPGRLQALHDAMTHRGLTSPFADWISAREAMDWPSPRVTTKVTCADRFEERDAALRAHATQIDPDGVFFAVPRDIEREVWPWEEYELAVSHVPTPPDEDDLFAGIDGSVAEGHGQAHDDIEGTSDGSQ